MPDKEPGAERASYCPGCGTKAVPGAAFCGSCGTSLTVGTGVQVGAAEAGASGQDPSPPIPGGVVDEGNSLKNRVWLVVAAVAVLALVAGGIAVAADTQGSSSPSTSQPAHRPVAVTNHTVAATLPVRECPTTQGVQGTSSSSIPATISVSLPPSVAKSVAYYSDSTRSVPPIMAPVGWSCSVMEAVDGGITIAVFPASESAAFTSQTSSPQPFTASKNMAVFAQSSGACQGCVAGIACPLIPYVGTQTGETTPCSDAQPAAEKVKWINGSPTLGSSTVTDDAVSFIDPPGVAGNGDPSGGPYPATGLLLYSYDREGSASVITCTLPSEQHSVCKAILDDFDTRNWPSTESTTTSTTQVPASTTSPPHLLDAEATIPLRRGSFSIGRSGRCLRVSDGCTVWEWPNHRLLLGRLAVLRNFTVQAGSGNGIAVFQQAGTTWDLIQFGDDSGESSDCGHIRLRRCRLLVVNSAAHDVGAVHHSRRKSQATECSRPDDRRDWSAGVVKSSSARVASGLAEAPIWQASAIKRVLFNRGRDEGPGLSGCQWRGGHSR